MIVAGIVFRRVLRAKRTWALGLLPALAVVVAFLAASQSGNTRAAYGSYVIGLLFPIVVALVSWVIAASAVTDEREELTILYVAQTPVSRLRTAAEIWLSAWAASMVLIALPLVMGIVLAGRAGVSAQAQIDLVVASALASAAYCGLGVLAAFYTKRAAVIGLIYVLLWESVMSGFAEGAKNLSVTQHARAIAARSADPWTRMELHPPTTSAGVALVVLVGIVAGSVLLAGRRFRRMNMP